MEDHFTVFTSGPGKPFRLDVAKIWIEEGKMYFKIIDWDETKGFPKDILKLFDDDIYWCKPSDMRNWVLREKKFVRETESQITDFKEHVLESPEESLSTEELVSEIKASIDEINDYMETLIKLADEKIQFKAKRSLTFFTSRIKEETAKFKVPDTIDNIKLINLKNSLQKLFTSIDFASKQTMSDLNKEIRPEMIEFDFRYHKLKKQHAALKKKKI